MTLLRWAGALALALIPSCAFAQTALPPIVAPSTIVPPSAQAFKDAAGATALVSPSSPLPVTTASAAAASSTPQGGTVTPSAATPTTGSASFVAGVATIGPLTPDLARGIRVVLRGTWSGTVQIGTSVNACATINPLTIGGSTWGSYTANANEVVDVPSLAGVVYCATATITSGTLAYEVRQ